MLLTSAIGTPYAMAGRLLERQRCVQ